MNKNINGHNGKEVHKDPIQKNVKKESDALSPDRKKKKYKGYDREIHPAEPRKDPVNVSRTNNPNANKNSSNPTKNTPKGQAMKMTNKDKGIHPVEPSVKKRPVEVMKPAHSSSNGKSFNVQAPSSNAMTNNGQSHNSETKKLDSSNTAKYLYIIAAVLLLAWIVGFFFYRLDANVHMLLALAIMVGVISFLQGKKK